MSLLSPGVFDAAMADLREKSKKRIYQRDFAAWLSDVLGERMYSKMGEISDAALLGDKEFTLVKSSNGTGKTHSSARWATWWCVAFEPRESLAIITAPTLKQVELGVLYNVKRLYGDTRARSMLANEPMPWPGWLTEQNEWKYATLGGNETLMVGRVPAPSDATTTLQGIRKVGGRNLIVADEAGGLSEEVYTAITALMTSGDSRMIGIGNPDRRGTEFYNRFNNADLAREHNLFSISAYDLPTVTGELVYPDEPDKQEAMLKGLTKRKWIAMAERSWMTGGELYFDEEWQLMRRKGGTPNGRFRSKVQGEFPGDADNTFFEEEGINKSMYETEREPDPEARPVLGVDIATTGDDESVIYINNNLHVRVFDKTVTYQDGDEVRETTGVWTKEDELTAARRVHAIAMFTNAREVRVDAGGIGSSVATYLMRAPEMKDRNYEVIRIKGANASADAHRWYNYRDEMHDHLRMLMHDGLIDLDSADTQLRDELLLITYTINDKRAIKIDKKRDMRTVLGGSPDRADALMYAVADTSALIDNPYAHLEKGDIVSQSPWEMLEWARSEMALV